MAGGEGAKERRRMKRLQASMGATTGKNDGKVQDNVDNSRNKGKTLIANNGTVKENQNYRKFASTLTSTKKKKANIKKPKHLKRRLEQATQENDEQIKEKLQQEMEEFQQKKEKHSKMKQKRQRIQKNKDEIQYGETRHQSNAVTDNDNSMDSDKAGSSTVDTKENESSQNPSQSVSVSSRAKSTTPSIQHDSEKDGNDESSDDTSSTESSSDDEEPSQHRSRGNRRRGRLDTAKKIEEMKNNKKETSAINTPGDEQVVQSSPTETEGADIDKTKKRYCIGRKPVTDFIIGQSYPGTVVYVKPFGVFLDIGCHSDAFCHLSRLSDDYVESPESMFKEGDKVPKARVVEIDRRKKHITVSLQSEARLVDERASIEARKRRNEARKAKSGKKWERGEVQTLKVNQVESNEARKEKMDHKKFDHTQTVEIKDPSTMTPAELKRARKLARRAARREQSEQGVQTEQ